MSYMVDGANIDDARVCASESTEGRGWLDQSFQRVLFALPGCECEWVTSSTPPLQRFERSKVCECVVQMNLTRFWLSAMQIAERPGTGHGLLNSAASSLICRGSDRFWQIGPISNSHVHVQNQ